MKIVFATKNDNKIREARALLTDMRIVLLSLKDFSDIPDVIEDGRTFEENALKKARALAQATGETVIADDSGLVVDFLGGAPGVFSARYAGADADDDKNIEKLLAAMRDAPAGQRGAKFVCCVALCRGRELDDFKIFEGHLDGEICFERAGFGGFGYDPVFYLPQRRCTMAQLSLDEKNKISHRAAAFTALKKFLASGSV